MTAMTPEQFFDHKLGRTFADVVTSDEYPFGEVLASTPIPSVTAARGCL